MGFLKKHPVLVFGLILTLIFLGLAYARVDFFDALELKYYDLRMNMGRDNASSDEIVLVDIDDESIDRIGRWPWPRSKVAEGITRINQSGAKLIGLNVIYSEPQESAALKELEYLGKMLAGSAKDPQLVQAVEGMMQRLDNDKKMADSLRNAENVVLPVYFKSSLVEDKNPETRKILITEALKNVKNPLGRTTPGADEIIVPIDPLLQAAKGIGHVNLSYDFDGKVRRDQLVYMYKGMYYPSFSLKIAQLYMNIDPARLNAVLGKSVELGKISIPTTLNTELLINFSAQDEAFKRYSFYEVLNNKIPEYVFKNKIVLITPTAAGIMNPITTPTAQVMSVGEFAGHSLRTMLNQRFIRQPAWNENLNYILIVVLGLVITFLLPRLKAFVAAIAFVLLLGGIIGGSIYMFVSKNTWVEATYPVLLLIFGYIGVVSIRFFVTETKKEKVEGESAETNRMLGISFQSQGMLDMAFDKFRKVPVDDEMKDVLYSLGLDFERKRQFNKAASVYEYIEKYDSGYKDVAQKKKKLLQASETMVYGEGFLGGGGGGTQADSLLTIKDGPRPTLGRYEVIKQLGKGAMGVVYLGKDPRINRTTAIKVFRFSDDFEPEEIEKMKQKFFREAESAGTLSHPNIVTIYDAGEEQELAYIAMELLEGDDLTKYTKKSALLPMRKVIDVVADVAEGLDYAHRKGVVHRDIKPANIMMLKTGVIKITDFGIARITASSQTQTGVVKGTPHYMSPEQISGEKVDGRSDIFSLGTMLFQLLTGRVPFHGDSPAALMHQIMNNPHPNPRKYNPKIVKPLVDIIDRAMEKDRDKRYQKAGHIANHLRMLGKKIDAITQQKQQQKQQKQA